MSFRALALTTTLAVSTALFAAAPAKAEFVTGTLSINGSNIVNLGADTITFLAGTSRVGAATGSFALQGFDLNDPATMRQEGIAQIYTSPTWAAGSNLACGAGCIYLATSGTGNTTSFNIVGPYTVTELPNFLNITAQGFVSLTGFQDTFGTFLFSSQGDVGSVTFSATTVAVPGPVVGAGLPGLVLAAGGLLAWVRRRRHVAA